MRRQRHARAAILSGLFGFVAIQLALAALLLWRMPWLRSPSYGHKAAGLQRALQTAEQPRTVIMLGSSRTAYALKGSSIEPMLSRDAGRPVVVYNFGLHGDGPVMNLLSLRRLLADGRRPDLLLVEVLPPLLSRHGPFADTSEAHLPTASLRREELALVQRYAGDQRPVRDADWWLGWCLPCYSHRFALLSHTVPTLLSLHDRLDGLRRTDPSGWAAVKPVSLSPACRGMARDWARQDYAPRLKSFVLGGPNVAALEEMLQLCRREQIRVGLVLMPEGPEFRSWYPRRVICEIRSYLAALGRRFDTPLIDARAWVAREDDFLDSHHLLPAGAEAFSHRLGEEVLRPLLRDPSPPPVRPLILADAK